MNLIGQPLPAFTLLDDQGNEVTQENIKGRWTLLYAYPKDNTPGCTQEACDVRNEWERFQAMGTQVYGISRDSIKSHKGFITKNRLPFHLLSDPDALLLKALGAFGKKIMCGQECEGVIRSSFLVDPQGIIRHVWPKVSANGHITEVIKVLEVLS